VLALVVGIGVAIVMWLGSSFPDAGTTGGAGGTGGGTTAAGTTMTVAHVHDGDTLFLDPGDGRDELKVRLIGIDTPEIGDRAECFGAEATARTRELLPEGTAVTVIAEDDPLDQYGRSLLHLYLADGTHLNRLLVDEGYAETMFFDPNRDFEAEFRDAERAAQAAGVGLWGACR